VVAEHVFADLLRSGNLTIVQDPIEATRAADALVLVTEWPEYRAITPAQLKSVMHGNLVLDGRNTLEAEPFKLLGFNYSGVGRR
jgi:UDPglucose 6-dehydrogenase